jgi:hypothetical protein
MTYNIFLILVLNILIWQIWWTTYMLFLSENYGKSFKSFSDRHHPTPSEIIKILIHYVIKNWITVSFTSSLNKWCVLVTVITSTLTFDHFNIYCQHIPFNLYLFILRYENFDVFLYTWCMAYIWKKNLNNELENFAINEMQTYSNK